MDTSEKRPTTRIHPAITEMLKNSIAIIGGAGFLGSRLAELFGLNNRKYTICDINIDHTIQNAIELDVENTISLDQLDGATTIINLAAVHSDDVRPLKRYDDVNVGGAQNICRAARKHNISKIIFTSSVAIFGFAPPDTAEDGVPDYFNDYGRTKYLAEAVYREWQSEDPEKRTLVIVRPTLIFGEGNRGNLYNLFRHIASGQFVMFGDGTNRKSMCYVENMAAFLEHCLTFNSGVHTYNYTDKPDLDMNTLVSLARKTLIDKNNVGLRLPAFLGIGIGYVADVIAKIIRKPLPVSRIRVKKFMRTTQFASSVNDTGFVPPVSLEEGLARTLRYEFLENNTDKQTFDTE